MPQLHIRHLRYRLASSYSSSSNPFSFQDFWNSKPLEVTSPQFHFTSLASSTSVSHDEGAIRLEWSESIGEEIVGREEETNHDKASFSLVGSPSPSSPASSLTLPPSFHWQDVTAISMSFKPLKGGRIFLEIDPDSGKKEKRELGNSSSPSLSSSSSPSLSSSSSLPSSPQLGYLLLDVDLCEASSIEEAIRQYGLTDVIIDERSLLDSMVLSWPFEPFYSRKLRVSWRTLVTIWEILLFLALLCGLLDKLYTAFPSLPDSEEEIESTAEGIAHWAHKILKRSSRKLLRWRNHHPNLYWVGAGIVAAGWPFAWAWWFLLIFATKTMTVTLFIFSIFHTVQILHLFLMTISDLRKKSSLVFLIFGYLRSAYRFFFPLPRHHHHHHRRTPASNTSPSLTSSPSSLKEN